MEGDSVPDNLPKKLMRAVDFNGNGSIDYSEFIAAVMGAELYMKAGRLKFVFKELDTNDDGFIERGDLERLFKTEGHKNIKKMNKMISKLIDEIDTNKDGKIDFEEFSAMMGELETVSRKISMDSLEDYPKNVHGFNPFQNITR